jgi:hypothetical protein
LNIKWWDSLTCSFRLKKTGINHDKIPLALLPDSFTLLNTELNNKQLRKCTYFKGLMLPPQEETQNLHNLFVFLLHVKGKAVPQHIYGGAGRKKRYSSYSFMTSALDGGDWSASCPSCALPLGKPPQYPLDRRQDGPQSRSGHRG